MYAQQLTRMQDPSSYPTLASPDHRGHVDLQGRTRAFRTPLNPLTDRRFMPITCHDILLAKDVFVRKRVDSRQRMWLFGSEEQPGNTTISSRCFMQAPFCPEMLPHTSWITQRAITERAGYALASWPEI